MGCLITLCLVVSSAFADDKVLVEFRGQWSQGGILVGRLLQPGSVWVDKKQLNVTESGDFVVGLGREHPAAFQLKIVDEKGTAHTLTYSVASRKFVTQRVNGVEQKMVEPPESVLKRISDEAVKVGSARNRNDRRDDFSKPFIWPLIGPITGVYGSQRVYNGVPKSPHYGLDIAGPVGAKVMAPAAGIITLAEPDLYFSGGTIIVDHGHSLSSTFLHLSRVLVTVGQRVEQGQIIAEVGATGRATGPHLDWRMNWFDQRVDPQLLMMDIPMSSQTSSNK
jgi:murein DD-endopeptidase MepM/ murein hydrolase activator NlpD